MISRREVLQGGAMTALALALPFGRMRRALAATPTTFDYYISANGSDDNPGTLAAPWSITALNSKMSTYAGKSIGIIGNTAANPTVINAGKLASGSAATSLFSIMQAQPGNNSEAVLLLNGGPSASQPTILATCDSSGNYSPRTAVIDGADPVTGALPTVSAPFIAQNQYQSTTQVSNYGNVVVDGLVIRNFTFAGLEFVGSANAPIDGAVIRNCELYNQQNVVSNNNPGAIRFNFAKNAIVTNCCVHDLRTNAAGSSFQMQSCGVIQFNSIGTTITNCTFFNCCAISNKDGWQSMNVSYCYCGWGSFGSPYTGESQYSNIGATIHNYLCGTGVTVEFHHNILIGPLGAWGESGQANEGTVLIYNNTFYKPSGIGGQNRGLMCFTDNYGANTVGGTGTFEFFNNIVYAEDGIYEDGNAGASCFVKMGASTGGIWSTLTNCDYNVYGSGMTFAQDWKTGDYGWPLSKWQGFGYDKDSTTLTSSPFTGSPSEANTASFAISGPAATAGKGGVSCGALDGSGAVGCDFVSPVHTPKASVLSIG